MSGILVLITSILLFNNARFGGVVILENLAYDVALSIRQAQVYGISVYRFGTGANPFDIGYGVHFETGGTPSVYVLFADASGNGIYDAGETVLSTTIENGFIVSGLCTTSEGGSETCGRTKLDILYKRPEPAAYVRANGETTLYSRARIILASPRGDEKSIAVEVSGQISVQ